MAAALGTDDRITLDQRSMQGNRDKVPLGTGQTPSLSVEDIRLALQGLHHGAVEITVHNGQIVQIERKDASSASASKTELTRPAY